MNRQFVLVPILFCLLPFGLCAAERDAAGCTDHPVVPRLHGYIVACGTANASFDMETATEGTPETIHIEGNSWAVAYGAPEELQPKPDREQILSRFEKAVGKHGASLAGTVNSTPVYKLVDGGKEFWVVVMADAVGGRYAYRIIAGDDMVQTRPEPNVDRLHCAEQYGPPAFAPLKGYELCGCGQQESGAREFKTGKGKTIRIEGRVTQMTYCPMQEAKSLNNAQIHRRFENLIKKQGGTRVGNSAKDARIDVHKVTLGGAESWVEVWAEESGNYNYVVTQRRN